MKQDSEPVPLGPTKPSASRSEVRARARARADRAHERYVQRTYGLAPGQYQQMLADQDGRCAICTRIPRNRRLAVDHDHFTETPRALLCYTCNKALGLWEFDPIAAYHAAQYLLSIYESLRHSLVETLGTEAS